MSDRFISNRNSNEEEIKDRYQRIKPIFKELDLELNLKPRRKNSEWFKPCNLNRLDEITNTISSDSEDELFKLNSLIKPKEPPAANKNADSKEVSANGLYDWMLQNFFVGGIQESIFEDYKLNDSIAKVWDSPNVLNFKKKRHQKGITMSSHLPESKIWNLRDKSYDKTWDITRAPIKVLDAPKLRDDYYLDLLDWSVKDFLAVGLENNLYLWDGVNGNVHKLTDINERQETSGNYVSSLAWSPDGTQLSLGSNNGTLEIWDVKATKLLRIIKTRRSRIGSLSWWSHTLAAGGRDNHINFHDLREDKHLYQRVSKHQQEVWGLKWSPGEEQLASGGNDNRLNIWSHRHLNLPAHQLPGHRAAVKALAWSNYRHGMLISGGGSKDGWIRFWNTRTGKLVRKVDTQSQIWNMDVSNTTNSLITTHGYSEVVDDIQNQLVVWNPETMKKRFCLKGHSQRILYLAMNQRDDIAVTGSGDETLRFWKLTNNESKLPEWNQVALKAEIKASKCSLKSIKVR